MLCAGLSAFLSLLPVLYQQAVSRPAMGPQSQPSSSAPAATQPLKDNLGLIPLPAELEFGTGDFPITAQTTVYTKAGDPDGVTASAYLGALLEATTGHFIKLREYTPTGPVQFPVQSILISLLPASGPVNPEAYEIQASAHAIAIHAARPPGLFCALQTVRQLLRQRPDGNWVIPALRIKDRPAYPWRGMLLDCGRHFMSKEFILRYIDLLALHKLNVLHWHLTEDQGWRLEIKKYPKLTEIGAWRGTGAARYGGYYTQEDVREIVNYAASRHVRVVPEIELPGHCRAALASYPELSCTGGPFDVATTWGVFEDVYCAGNEQTFAFLEDVLTEVIELFPSEFIHIGGDEVPRTRWRACPKCQARLRAEGLAGEDELQSYFIRRIERFLNSRGRQLVGWDEIMDGGLPPKAIVQAWRGADAALRAARAGYEVISSPTSHCYLDYPQAPDPTAPTSTGYIDLRKIYSFDAAPPGLTPEERAYIIGGEGNIWTERAPQERVDRQVFPRLCALAEVLWTPPERRNWEDFQGRLRYHYRRLDALGVMYYVPPPALATPELTFEDAVAVSFVRPLEGARIHYTLDGSEPTSASPQYTEPFTITETKLVKARLILPTGNASDVAEFQFHKSAARERPAEAQRAPGAH